MSEACQYFGPVDSFLLGTAINCTDILYPGLRKHFPHALLTAG
jgi:hypothetical protein